MGQNVGDVGAEGSHFRVRVSALTLKFGVEAGVERINQPLNRHKSALHRLHTSFPCCIVHFDGTKDITVLLQMVLDPVQFHPMCSDLDVVVRCNVKGLARHLLNFFRADTSPLMLESVPLMLVSVCLIDSAFAVTNVDKNASE